MLSFRIYDASIPREYADWVAVWKSWPQREVSAHPGYVRLFASSYDRTCCAVLQDIGGSVLFPFILRPLDAEKWTKIKVWDLVTPYGYGGAFIRGTVDAESFWGRFNEWAKHTKVVSSFVRLSLFPELLIPFPGEIEVKAHNVVRTLDLDYESIWMDYAHKVRKNVKKAQRNGLKIQIDLKGSRLREFIEVYYLTMHRRNAAGRYYFTKEFFQNIVRDLTGQFVFFHTLQEDKIVSTELVLVSANYLYSFLGGTLPQAYPLRANDLLKHAIIEWGREQRKRAFVLGGGYEDGDGIFHYKRSFAPHGVVPFRVGKCIYDTKSYEKLIEQRSQWEKGQGRNWEPRPDFFPAYRS